MVLTARADAAREPHSDRRARFRSGPVGLLTRRDLQWRRRRFAVGTLGTALVFAVSLLLAGFAAALHSEADHTMHALGADGWVISAGVNGPFSGVSAMPASAVSQVAKAPGVQRADPLVFGFATVTRPGRDDTDVTMFGYRPGGLGSPLPDTGRPPARVGEAVVDRSLGVDLGEAFTLSGRRMVAVGEVHGLTLRGGVPNVYVPLIDAQSIVFKGAPIITVVLTKGFPGPGASLEVAGSGPVPDVALRVITADAAEVDLLRIFRQALDAIDLLRVLLWVVAGAIVGTVVYLSVLDRLQDLAVCKAIGVATATLFGSLVMQAVLLSVLAAGLATGIALLLAPGFPLPIELRASTSLLLLGIAVAVGLVASLAALRRAVRVDPAAAFGGA